MTIKYRLVPMKFDTLKWSKAIASIPAKDRRLFGDLIGVSGSTLATWANIKMRAEFPFPSMSAFIATCNELDLNPADFFILEEE